MMAFDTGRRRRDIVMALLEFARGRISLAMRNISGCDHVLDGKAEEAGRRSNDI